MNRAVYFTNPLTRAISQIGFLPWNQGRSFSVWGILFKFDLLSLEIYPHESMVDSIGNPRVGEFGRMRNRAYEAGAATDSKRRGKHPDT
jgi:hypothetical protein